MEDLKSESVEDILENNRPYIELMSRVNNSLAWIRDRTSDIYLYLSPNFKDILGCDPSNLRKRQPTDFLTKFMHPNDLPVLYGIQNRYLEFMSELATEKKMSYKHIFGFRILHKGKWTWVIEQRQILGISADNKLVMMGFVDFSPNQSPDQVFSHSLVNIRTGDIVSLTPDININIPVVASGFDTGNYEMTTAAGILKNNKVYIDLLTRSGNSCVYVEERETNTFLYMSPNFHDIWGYDPVGLKQIQAVEYLARHIHPDDIAAFCSIQYRILEFINTLSVKERLCYKYVFELRAQHKGKWLRIISKHQLLGISSDYGPVVLGIVEISPNQISNQTVSFRLINAKTGDTVPLPGNENIDLSLTGRELEILNLANEGLLNKEISDRLSISIHTVSGHRQNIFRKMNVQNLTEAINLARKQGLLA